MGAPLLFVVLGRQGSGKGTQCEFLAEAFGVVHISTGDMLRSAGGTEVGDKAKSIMDAGELVGDDLMCQLVAERLSQPDIAQKGVILDGFPRNPIQAQALFEILENLDFSLDRVFNIEVPNETVIERMLDRAREDDTQEAIERRLEIYEEQTAPLIEWFEKRGKLSHIDGTGTPEEVFELIKGYIDQVPSEVVDQDGAR